MNIKKEIVKIIEKSVCDVCPLLGTVDCSENYYEKCRKLYEEQGEKIVNFLMVATNKLLTKE